MIFSENLRNFCIVGAFSVALAFPGQGAAQSGVEGGVEDLAKQIVMRAGSETTTTIAISAFPHVDDTCSELSNFLVDELVLSLFSIPDANLQIIERSQLGRIFAELELSLSGAVDANTTQELGRIHGVDTLLVGTLTTLGDDLRVNARLLNTETGQVFSAAAVNIPKTSTVEDLMSREAAGGCTMSLQGGNQSGGGGTSASPGSGSANLSLPAFEGELKIEELAGKWSGQLTCDGTAQPFSAIFQNPSPVGLQAWTYRSTNTTGSSSQGSLLYDARQKEGGGWFTLTDHGGIGLQLISEAALYGEFTNDEGKACSVYIGKYE